jgi:hypothetical protein
MRRSAHEPRVLQRYGASALLMATAGLWWLFAEDD